MAITRMQPWHPHSKGALATTRRTTTHAAGIVREIVCVHAFWEAGEGFDHAGEGFDHSVRARACEFWEAGEGFDHAGSPGSLLPLRANSQP